MLSNQNFITGKYEGDVLQNDAPPYLLEIDTWMGDKWLNTNKLDIIGFAEIPKFRFSSDFTEKIKLNFNRQLRCAKREIYMRKKHYPPLVSQELWERCQEIRTGIKAANKPFKYAEKEFLYRGLIRCANSGRICSCELKKEQFEYVVCYTKEGKRKYISAQDITDQIAYILHSIKIPEDMVKGFNQYLKSSKDAEIKFRNEELTKLKADLSRTLNRLERLCNMYLDGEINKDSYQHKNNELIAEKNKIQAQITAHSAADDGFNALISELIDIANNSWDIFLKSPDLGAKRNLLKFLFRTLEINEGKLGYALTFPYDKLSNLGSHPLWSGL